MENKKSFKEVLRIILSDGMQFIIRWGIILAPLVFLVMIGLLIVHLIDPVAVGWLTVFMPTIVYAAALAVVWLFLWPYSIGMYILYRFDLADIYF